MFPMQYANRHVVAALSLIVLSSTASCEGDVAGPILTDPASATARFSLTGKKKWLRTRSRPLPILPKKRRATDACARKIVMGTAIPPRLGGLMAAGRTCTACRTRGRRIGWPTFRTPSSATTWRPIWTRCATAARRSWSPGNARSVVLMSEEDYDGLMETVHLLNSPANASRLLRSIADADRDMLTNARSPWPSRAERAR